MVANIGRVAFSKARPIVVFDGMLVLIGFLHSVKVVRELGNTFKKYAK